MVTGMATLRYFTAAEYNWQGLSQQPSLLGMVWCWAVAPRGVQHACTLHVACHGQEKSNMCMPSTTGQALCAAVYAPQCGCIQLALDGIPLAHVGVHVAGGHLFAF